jgi:hypothetical protein
MNMATQNSHILIATFSDYITARQAANELTDHGVPEDSVHIDVGESQTLRATVPANYRESVTEILNRHGASTVETRSPDLASAGTTDETRAEMTGTKFNRGTTVHLPTPGVLSGFGSTAGAGTLAGEATAGSAVQDFAHRDFTSGDFTAEIRRDFEQNYGSDSDFESMRPAYEYGHRTARETRYADVPWDRAENDLRSDYERDNPGTSWEKVKNAIRYGWEKMTGQR